MNYIEPKPLKKGDTIAFIAPAGAVRDIKAIERAKKYFETNGYNVVYSKHLFNINKYFSDTDENRLADLHEAFKNPKIDAIICARGGYGCLRLVDKIDYDLIKNNPKIFCGYSDITVLSAMFLKRSGLITYSGAMAKGDFGAEKISDFTTANFYKAVEQKEKLSFTAQKTCNTVQAKGTLFGGNLASVVSLCGIEFLPDEDFIFFCEDLNEPVYKIDKMLTQLLNMKNFRTNVKAVVTGDFLECGYPEQLDELFFDISKELNIPVFGGFKIT
ncbi:MAG: LD-carboxypeptidase, partial [Candidatus Gastranaerophilales bacterium]|nr:LD-carboxypeptidase [Candidatus Gastranaerophilales bacterium]